jgi:hypothetical protein
MKKILFCLMTLAAGMLSCKKETVVSKVVRISYPTITLHGNAVISTGIGTGSYTDPGATGYDDVAGVSKELTPVSNNVDLTKPGFYNVTYSMTNANGYITTAIRLVLVTSVNAAIDWSGTYKRVSNGQHVTITKKATGLYTTDNIGGVSGNPAFLFPVYIGQTTDTSIQVPPQLNPFGGNVFCTNETFSLTAADTTFSYVVMGSNFGTAVRVFTHHP